MNNITDRSDINNLLMQMREMRSQVQSNAPAHVAGVENAGAIRESGETGAPGFTDMLRQAVDSVNETQQQSGALQRAFEAGDPNVDITQVMIQMQKASVSFEAMNQVRNRLVSAYQDIMNMPI